jgi:hypothetical protein
MSGGLFWTHKKAKPRRLPRPTPKTRVTPRKPESKEARGENEKSFFQDLYEALEAEETHDNTDATRGSEGLLLGHPPTPLQVEGRK